MAMITSKTIDVNGIRMHVTEGGAAPVRAFQSGKAPVFLLSLKAGGTGLNLTAADTVIHITILGGTPPSKLGRLISPTASARTSPCSSTS